MLLGFIGILSSLLQGGFIRRTKTPPTARESSSLSFTFSNAILTRFLPVAARGILTCSFSLFLLAILPFFAQSNRTLALSLLYTAAAGLAFVSATVVNSLNSLASLETGILPSGEEVEKGKYLGIFRSRGQLGRATGPILSTVIYFVGGPSWSYGMCGVGVLLVASRMGSKIKDEKKKVE